MLERLGLLAAAALMALAPASAAGATDVSYQEVWRFADPEIVESSGLVVGAEHVVTVNDSGDSGRVFVVSRQTGETVGVTRWSDRPRDVEALAPAADGWIWVGDIGDNLRRREAIEVLRIPVGPGDRTVRPERYRLVYPDRAADAETLLAHPETGQLFVVTKNVFGGTVFAAPQRLDPDRPNELVEVGPVVGLATDGAFFPDGRHVLIRTYARALVYRYPEFELVGAVDTPDQEQGEGVAVAPDGEVYLSSEGVRSPLLRLQLPVLEADSGPTEEASGAGEHRPAEHASGDGPWWSSGAAVGAAVVAIVVVAVAGLTRARRR